MSAKGEANARMTGRRTVAHEVDRAVNRMPTWDTEADA
jgi:hypothetical protein